MHIDYYVSLQSPWTYFGHSRICRYAKEAGATLTIWPVNFADVFSETGGLPLPKRSPERRNYRMLELQRWREHLGIPLNLEPKHYPAKERVASLCVVGLREQADKVEARSPDSRALKFAGNVLEAVWKDEQDVSDETVLKRLLEKAGADPEKVLNAVLNQEFDSTHEQYTREAIERGVFGAPAYRVDGELFWGQDRLPFVAAKLGLQNL